MIHVADRLYRKSSLRRVIVFMKKQNQKQQANVITQSVERPCKVPFPGRQTRLEIPPGDPDIEGLRSVTREWLVPRLVEKFLRMHSVELGHSRAIGAAQIPYSPGQKPNTECISRGRGNCLPCEQKR